MRPYTTVGNKNEEELRANWRGNKLSKRDSHKKPKGRSARYGFIGNKNYHRKKCDRTNKKSYRQSMKRIIKRDLDEE